MLSTVLSNTSAELARSWIAVGHADELVDAPISVHVLGEPWVVWRREPELRAACGRDGRRPAGVVEHLGLIWIAVEDPLAPLPHLPGWAQPGFVTARCATVRTPVSAVQLIDNFMDAAHFPFVHPQSFGVEDAFGVSNDDIVSDGWEVRSTFDAPYQHHDDPLVGTGEHPLVQDHTVLKVGYAACNAGLELRFPLTGGVFGIAYACQPETSASTRVFKIIARNDLDAAGMAQCVIDEDAILLEDLAILERYPQMCLDTDLTVEVHTKADRLSVAWRRLMRDLQLGQRRDHRSSAHHTIKERTG